MSPQQTQHEDEMSSSNASNQRIATNGKMKINEQKVLPLNFSSGMMSNNIMDFSF